MAGRVLLDLNSPVFLDELLSPEKTELVRVVKALKKIRSMDWETFVRHRASNGKPAHSFRLSQKYRALAYREGDFLRVLSLHLDHDSAYED